jgi:hypothetical protein
MALRATLKDETVQESRLKGGCSQDWLPHSFQNNMSGLEWDVELFGRGIQHTDATLKVYAQAYDLPRI